MGLRIDPTGGGQLNAALKQIIEVEKQPIKSLEARKEIENQRMKTFQDFKSKFSSFSKALDEISTYNKFRELKVELGDGQKLVDITLDKEKAQPGAYDIRVNQLAARSSIVSKSMKSDKDANLGIGFVVLNLPGGDTKEIYVDAKDASLNGIAQLINKDQNSPVRASVMKDEGNPDEPFRLIISSKADGEAKQVEFPDFYFLDGDEDFWIDNSRDARNALLEVDGFEIETGGNMVADFLPGINMKLKQAGPDTPFTMTISEDPKKSAGKMKLVVDQVNQILEFITKQNAVDQKSDTRTMLTGDTSIQTIEFRLRNLLHEGFPIGDPDSDAFRFGFLHQIGVEFEKTGQLKFNEEKFTKALEKDYDGVAEVVSGEVGFANQLRTVMNLYTRPYDGLLATKEKAMRDRIRQIDQNIEVKERNLDRRTESLKNQFSRLQAALQNMQAQQQYVTAALGSSGGNIVSQLMGG